MEKNLFFLLQVLPIGVFCIWGIGAVDNNNINITIYSILYQINTTIYGMNRRICLPKWYRALPGQCGAGVSFKGKVSLSVGYEAWYGKSIPQPLCYRGNR